MYGEKTDKDLNVTHFNTANIFDELLNEFKGDEHCVTMDSAYMRDIMAKIGRE